ncbi:transketolase family protein, partial [bacterium]|nr:transketolase family protein [bacterium]
MVSIREGFGMAINELGEKNENILVLTADLKDSLKLGVFAKNYPKRFYEFGIAEQNMLSAASGMTKLNKIPFVCSYAAFNPGRNWDQLRVSVCYSNANVKIVGGHAGLLTGPDGASHQALEDIAITRCLPNLRLVVPCDGEEAKKATLAIANEYGPFYLRVSREKTPEITNSKTPFKIGKANILNEGKDIIIVSCGAVLQFAILAQKELEKENIFSTIINMHTIKPLDTKTLVKFAKISKKILVIEEHQKYGGLFSAISEYFSSNYPILIDAICMEDSFG